MSPRLYTENEDGTFTRQIPGYDEGSITAAEMGAYCAHAQHVYTVVEVQETEFAIWRGTKIEGIPHRTLSVDYPSIKWSTLLDLLTNVMQDDIVVIKRPPA